MKKKIPISLRSEKLDIFLFFFFNLINTNPSTQEAIYPQLEYIGTPGKERKGKKRQEKGEREKVVWGRLDGSAGASTCTSLMMA